MDTKRIDIINGLRFSSSRIRLGGPTDMHRANIIPTGLEKELVEENIQYANSGVHHLDHTISLIHPDTKVSKELKRYREAMYRFEMQERSYLAPIRKLPADVLREVFLHARLDTTDGWTSIDDPKDIVRILVQVSTYWRKVARSCAFLWSKVRTKPSSTYPQTGILGRRASLDFLYTCILLSNESPFSVSTGFHDSCFGSPDILGERCIVALARCAYRWHEISIKSGEVLLAIVNKIPPNTSLEQLDSLLIHELPRSIYLPPSPKLSKLIITNPDSADTVHLQSVTSVSSLILHDIRNSSFISNFKSSIANWSQITHFEADTLNPLKEFHSELQNMPNLVYLSLSDSWSDSFSTAKPTFSLPHLEHLKIFISVDSILDPEAFDIFLTPALKVLEVSGSEDMSPINFSRFAQRSGFALEVLELQNMPMCRNLEAAGYRSINTFTWIYPDNVAEGIQWLTRDNTKNNFPRLEKLKLANLLCDLNDDDVDENYDEIAGLVTLLITMIKSRLPGIPDQDKLNNSYFLKTVDILFEITLPKDSVKEFKQFVQSDAVPPGVEIALRSFNVDHLNTTDFALCYDDSELESELEVEESESSFE